MKRAAVAGLVVVLVLPVLVITGALGALDSATGQAPGEWGGQPEALADIPAAFLALYRQAAARFGIPVELLAAIGKVECDHGRDPACDHPNAAGAEGPMQFLPTTFAAYAWAADTPNPSPYDPHDAIFAAAAKLAADNIVTDPAAAILAYNHATWYLALVVAWAAAYGYLPSQRLAALAVLNHPDLALRPEAAGDVQAGRVDARVLTVLLVLATSHRLDQVGPLITGHAYLVEGTNHPSNHAFGRAADLPMVDGVAVSAANPAALQVAEEIAALPPPLRPDELGCPWPLTVPQARTFTKGHSTHIHYGYDS